MTPVQVIVSILKDLGIYAQAKEKFETDEALAECFDQDFDRLITMFAAG
ncbi:MAG: hypothetical protein ABIL06_00625 [Pseudomonadota bacterium]